MAKKAVAQARDLKAFYVFFPFRWNEHIRQISIILVRSRTAKNNFGGHEALPQLTKFILEKRESGPETADPGFGGQRLDEDYH